jgi:hypothetical protein
MIRRTGLFGNDACACAAVPTVIAAAAASAFIQLRGFIQLLLFSLWSMVVRAPRERAVVLP